MSALPDVRLASCVPPDHRTPPNTGDFILTPPDPCATKLQPTDSARFFIAPLRASTLISVPVDGLEEGGRLLGGYFTLCQFSCQALNGTIQQMSLSSALFQAFYQTGDVNRGKTPAASNNRCGVGQNHSNERGDIPCGRSRPGD